MIDSKKYDLKELALKYPWPEKMKPISSISGEYEKNCMSLTRCALQYFFDNPEAANVFHITHNHVPGLADFIKSHVAGTTQVQLRLCLNLGYDIFMMGWDKFSE